MPKMNGCLFLYSDQVIEENRVVDACLLDAIGKDSPKVAYISSEPDPDKHFFKLKQEYYDQIGIELSSYYDENTLCSSKSVDCLSQYDAIHLSGGNTFKFLSWIRKYNLIDVLTEYVELGGVLIGTSAGSILMTPSIETALLCGDKNQSGETNFHAMGMTDFYYLPHQNTEFDREAFGILNLDRKLNVMCAADGSGIAVTSSGVRCIGDVKVVSLAPDADIIKP